MIQRAGGLRSGTRPLPPRGPPISPPNALCRAAAALHPPKPRDLPGGSSQEEMKEGLASSKTFLGGGGLNHSSTAV